MVKNYIVSFGDSGKYLVPFDGDKDEFEKSHLFQNIKSSVFDYVKRKFPAVDINAVLPFKVETSDGYSADYSVIDNENIVKIKHDAARQVEVMMQDKKMNDTAPFGE